MVLLWLWLSSFLGGDMRMKEPTEYMDGYVDGWNDAIKKVQEIFEPIRNQYNILEKRRKTLRKGDMK